MSSPMRTLFRSITVPRHRIQGWLAMLLMLFAFAGGCQSETTGGAKEEEEHHHHGHGDQFKDFPTALKQTSEIRAHLAAELKSKHYRHAADEIAELREVLVAIPEMAADSDQPEDEWNLVNQSCQQLLTLCAAWEQQLRADRSNFSETERFEREFAELQRLADRETLRLTQEQELKRKQDELTELTDRDVPESNSNPPMEK